MWAWFLVVCAATLVGLLSIRRLRRTVNPWAGGSSVAAEQRARRTAEASQERVYVPRWDASAVERLRGGK